MYFIVILSAKTYNIKSYKCQDIYAILGLSIIQPIYRFEDYCHQQKFVCRAFGYLPPDVLSKFCNSRKSSSILYKIHLYLSELTITYEKTIRKQTHRFISVAQKGYAKYPWAKP